MKLDLKRYVFFVLGIVILTLGVSLTVKSGMGAGAYDSINFALSDIFKINISLTIGGTSLIIVFLVAAIRKSVPKFTTFITSLIMGIFTDMWVRIIENLKVDTLMGTVVVFVMGMFLVSLGITIYLIPKLPVNPTDDFMLALTEKKWSIMKAKLVIDITCIVIAFLLKGPIGIGTIILTFGVGPGISFINNVMFKFKNKLVIQ